MGLPRRTGASSTTGVYRTGAGNGLRFTLSTAAAAQVLHAYIGQWQSKAKLTVSIDDGVTPDYVTELDNPYGYGPYDIAVRIPAGAGRTVTVDLVMQVDYDVGNVSIDGATLQPVSDGSPRVRWPRSAARWTSVPARPPTGRTGGRARAAATTTRPASRSRSAT
jgi:hypothetical protein